MLFSPLWLFSIRRHSQGHFGFLLVPTRCFERAIWLGTPGRATKRQNPLKQALWFSSSCTGPKNNQLARVVKLSHPSATCVSGEDTGSCVALWTPEGSKGQTAPACRGLPKGHPQGGSHPFPARSTSAISMPGSQGVPGPVPVPRVRNEMRSDITLTAQSRDKDSSTVQAPASPPCKCHQVCVCYHLQGRDRNDLVPVPGKPNWDLCFSEYNTIHEIIISRNNKQNRLITRGTVVDNKD